MELGLQETELWRLTPREYRALSDRVAEREQRADHRFGVVASIAANMMRDAEQHPRPYEPADFFGSLGKPRAFRASDEEIAAAWEAWALGAQKG